MPEIIGFRIYSHASYIVVISSGIKTVYDVKQFTGYNVEFTDNDLIIHLHWLSCLWPGEYVNRTTCYKMQLGLLDFLEKVL